MTPPKRIYVAPTEPISLKTIATHVTLLPETMGCDVLIYSYNPYILVGIQRKELSDLLASLADGRLAKELLQMADSPLTYKNLIIEGTPEWSTDNQLLRQYGQPLTRTAMTGICTEIQSFGVLLHWTSSLAETVTLCEYLADFLTRPTHNSLLRRPKSGAKNSWGLATSNSFAIHLLQSFPGIGVTTAQAILSHYSGVVPLRWTTNVEELSRVPGIGRRTAQKLINGLATD